MTMENVKENERCTRVVSYLSETIYGTKGQRRKTLEIKECLTVI